MALGSVKTCCWKHPFFWNAGTCRFA